MNDKTIRQYLGAVKKDVRCSAKRKRVFLTELEAELREFAQEMPDLTMEQLTDAFGTPQKQAQDFMETLDAKEIKKAFSWKHMILIAVVAVVVVWLIAVVAMWFDGHKQVNGYGKEYYVDENSNRIEITEVLQD